MKKSLDRLHKKGIITTTRKACFKKEDNFEVLIFVYGLLKRGFDNNYFLKDAIYISKGYTAKKFAMYKADDGNYPY